jgi:hypothetical protein
MIAFEDIKVILFYESGTHYPYCDNYLGSLLDALQKVETESEILNKMRFQYAWERRPNQWVDAACTENPNIFGAIPMMINPHLHLKDQKGLFHLLFFGERVTGVFSQVDTFAELLRLKGLRKAYPAPITPTTSSCIPKRIEIARF